VRFGVPTKRQIIERSPLGASGLEVVRGGGQCGVTHGLPQRPYRATALLSFSD
jgi:hypothetical protein